MYARLAYDLSNFDFDVSRSFFKNTPSQVSARSHHERFGKGQKRCSGGCGRAVGLVKGAVSEGQNTKSIALHRHDDGDGDGDRDEARKQEG